MTQQTSAAPGTATTAGARAHARAQEAAAEHVVPAAPDGVEAFWAEQVAGGGYAHRVLARGTSVRLADPLGDACAHVLLFNADLTVERLNVADTVKAY